MKNEVLRKCIEKYNSIIDYKDLERNGLTLAEYRMLEVILDDIINKHIPSRASSQGVANWCKRNGLIVKYKTIDWTVTAPEN